MTRSAPAYAPEVTKRQRRLKTVGALETTAWFMREPEA